MFIKPKIWMAVALAIVASSVASAHAQSGLAPSTGITSGMDKTASGGAKVAGPQDQVLNKVRFDQKMNSQVPLDLEFQDESGQTVRLSKYFHTGKPVVLSMIFYNCTMMCTEVMNGEARLLNEKDLGFKVGQDFEMVTVSIHPKETPALATIKKKNYLKSLKDASSGQRGWHFLVGKDESIKKLADAVGFRYTYDAQTDQYAHPGGIMMLTPEGKVARYLMGIDYPAKTTRYAMIESSQGHIGTPLERFALYTCFHFDPEKGSYSLSIMRMVQLAAIATVLGLATGIGLMRRWEIRMKQRQGQTATLVNQA